MRKGGSEGVGEGGRETVGEREAEPTHSTGRVFNAINKVLIYALVTAF